MNEIAAHKCSDKIRCAHRPKPTSHRHVARGSGPAAKKQNALANAHEWELANKMVGTEGIKDANQRQRN